MEQHPQNTSPYSRNQAFQQTWQNNHQDIPPPSSDRLIHLQPVQGAGPMPQQQGPEIRRQRDEERNRKGLVFLIIGVSSLLLGVLFIVLFVQYGCYSGYYKSGSDCCYRSIYTDYYCYSIFTHNVYLFVWSIIFFGAGLLFCGIAIYYYCKRGD